MGVIICIILATILRNLPYGYMIFLMYILHFTIYTAVYIGLKADTKEYDIENDGLKVKNGVSIVIQATLMMIYIKSSCSFTCWYLIIPIILDLVSIPILYNWFYDIKKSVIYGALISFHNNKSAIILTGAFLAIDKLSIPVAIAILFIGGFVNSLINKLSK